MTDMTSFPSLSIKEILAWLLEVAPNAQLSSDSRTVAKGDVFFAYPGDAADGRQYIEHAIVNGAQAILYEVDGFVWNDVWMVRHLAVAGLKKMAGQIASAYYGQPDKNMFTVAVTGTNGKTSCTQWLGAVLSRVDALTAVIGTLGVGLFHHGENSGFSATGYTTPDAVLLQRKLAEIHIAGAKTLAIEASSIGLDQDRLNGMHIDVALLTNFTRDHLDYHGDMTAYETAKHILFDWPGLRHAVVNLDDEMGLRVIRRMQERNPAISITGYTLLGTEVESIASLRGSEIRSSHGGTTFRLDSLFGSAQVKTQLVGHFNVGNILGIVGVLLAKNIPFKTVINAVQMLTAVPGRMQQFGGQDAPLVVIDYAHTPDALEKTLLALRDVAQERCGQLWCVFGCGGDRDPGKRPQMGAVSAVADCVVITSDNPRSEEPSAIIAQILAGMTQEKAGKVPPQVIENRAAAILWAVKHAVKNDVILLAGKGHETYQEVKGRKLPFMDAEHAALALATRATMKGMH